MSENVLIHKMKVENEILGIHKDFNAINTVSLEGIGDVILGLGNMFGKRLNIISNFFGGKNTKSFSDEVLGTTSGYKKQLELAHHHTENIVRNKPTSMVLDTEVLMPLGYKGDLLKTSKDLDKGLRLIEANLFRLLNEVDTHVSYVLADEGTRLSSRPVKKDTEKAALNKDLNKILKDNVATSGTEEIVKLRQVVPNVNSLRDIHEILKNVSPITSLPNMKKIEGISINIRKKCEELYNISRKNEQFRIKKEVLVNLGNELEEAAMLITNSSAIISFYIQIVNCFITAVTKINGK